MSPARLPELILALVCLWAVLTAQPAAAQSANPAPAQVADTPYAVVERGANHRVWERSLVETGPAGQPVARKHRYTELATGLYYADSNGQLQESQEIITPVPTGGAAATQGQHQVYFPYDIYAGAIDQVTPEGIHLRSRPLCIAYACGTNTVLISELTNSIGQITAAGTAVIYTNCTTDFACDLVATYRKSGFECDLIIRQKPPQPDAFQLDPDQTVIQLWTEFFDAPEPVQQPAPITTDGLRDTTLQFGGTTMGRGSAFRIGSGAQQPAPPWKAAKVYKSWIHIDNRTFLVEQLPYSRIANDLDNLAAADKPTRWYAKAAPGPQLRSSTHPTIKPALPPRRPVRPSTKPLQLAKADLASKSGFCMDYQTLNGAATNFVCRGDSTYFLSGQFTCFSNLTVEAGSVIKATNGVNDPGFNINNGSVISQTGPYRYAVFTSMHDRSVGEDISGSTGSPSLMGNVIFISCQSAATHGQPWQFQHLRASYALAAFIGYDDSPVAARHCQFVNCEYGFGSVSTNVTAAVTAENCLFRGASWPIYAGGQLIAVNLTVDGCTNFCDTPDALAGLALTNCIIVGTNHWILSDTANPSQPTPILDNTVVQAASSGLFQSVGAASYYLCDSSTNRNYGSTNISPILLADLSRKTTYSPIVYSNVTISAATTFSPQAQRESGAPDLGFGYDPLDYCFGGVSASANLAFTAGTAAGWFELPGSGGPGYGIGLENSVTNAFNGTATAPCILARYYAVQEGGNGLWKDKGWLGGIASFNNDSSQTPQVTASFTHFAETAGSPNHIRDYSNPIVVRANNSEFWSGQDGGYGIQLYATNCLFDRCPVGFSCTCPAALVMRNCTTLGASLSSSRSGTTWPVWIENSAFDGTDLSGMDDSSGGNTNITYCDFNAFLTNSSRLPIHGAHDVLVTNFNWQSSWFGNFYLPTNSPLINTGSVTADLVGLYHFTTQTNQIKETNSIVDISYHYVAVDTNGIPIDTNGDGIPDYLSDSNGNGLVDSGEIGWNIAGDPGLKVIITRPRNGSAIP